MSGSPTRFAPEEAAALAAYLDIALRALEGPVASAVPTAQDKARADLGEAITVLDRIRWHLLAEADVPPPGLSAMRQEEQAFARQRMAAPPSAPRAAVNAAALQEILRRRVIGAEKLVIESIRVVAGGRSKLTGLVTQSGCATLPAELVLRQDWAAAVTGTSVAAEFELLSILSETGMLAPCCFLYEGGGTELGGAFMLVSRLEGRTRGDIFQPPASRALALQLAAQIGKLHSLPIAQFRHIEALASRDAEAGTLATRLAEFSGINQALGQPIACIDRAFAWLRSRLPTFQPVADVLVHGDLGWHNLLVEDDRLTALLDWELAHFGNPAEDLGYIKGDIEQMVPWPQFMAAYRAAGGTCHDDADIDFYFVWGLVRLYVLLLQARAGLKAGLVQDVAVARVCADSIPRLVVILADGLQRIVEATEAIQAVPIKTAAA